MSITEIISFLASSYLYRLLQTIWTQIRTGRMSALLWIQNVWHSDSIPEFFEEKKMFGKRSADANKNMENYPAFKEFRHWYLVNSLSSTSWNWKKKIKLAEIECLLPLCLCSSNYRWRSNDETTYGSTRYKTGFYSVFIIWVARCPTMWYLQPAKAQTSLHIRTVWSEHMLVAWILYECWATDRTAFAVSKLNRRLHRLVWVYSCQNATWLEITFHGSFIDWKTTL